MKPAASPHSHANFGSRDSKCRSRVGGSLPSEHRLAPCVAVLLSAEWTPLVPGRKTDGPRPGHERLATRRWRWLGRCWHEPCASAGCGAATSPRRRGLPPRSRRFGDPRRDRARRGRGRFSWVGPARASPSVFRGRKRGFNPGLRGAHRGTRILCEPLPCVRITVAIQSAEPGFFDMARSFHQAVFQY